MVQHQTEFSIHGIHFTAKWIFHPDSKTIISITELNIVGHLCHDITAVIRNDVSVFDQFAGELKLISERIIQNQ